MPKHEIKLQLPPKTQVTGSDFVFHVKSDGRTLGRLKVSKGDLRWFPRSAKQGRRVTWEAFDQWVRER
jgi:hypothetical protein